MKRIKAGLHWPEDLSREADLILRRHELRGIRSQAHHRAAPSPGWEIEKHIERYQAVRPHSRALTHSP